MRLESARIEKFRCIKECDINFNDLTAVVGENNAGKTAILRALNAVFNFEQERYSFESNAHKYATRRGNTKISLTFTDVPTTDVYVGKIENDKLEVTFEYAYGNKRQKKLLYLTSSKIPTDDSFIAELKKDIDFMYIPAYRNSNDLACTETSLLGRVITAFLHSYTQNRDEYSVKVKRVADAISKNCLPKIAKQLSQLSLLDNAAEYSFSFADVSYDDFLHKLNINVADGKTMPVCEYGSGTNSLTIIALYRLLAQLNNMSIILGIEEPETNLHPQAQKKLIYALKQKKQDSELQAIFATHSSAIIDELRHEDVVLIRRIKDPKRGYYSKCTQLPKDFWKANGIDEFKHNAFFQYKNSDFFFAKYVVIVEGAADAQVFSIMLKKALGDKFYDISILNTGGVEGLKYPFFLLKSLEMPFSIIIDKDFFVNYKSGELNKSRGADGFPIYCNTLKRKRLEKNDIINILLKTKLEINALKEAVRKSHKCLFDFMSKRHVYSMRYCLEMDLLTSKKALELIYNQLNVAEENKSQRYLLEKMYNAIKEKQILQIVDQLEPVDYPISFNRIRKGIVEDINKHI